jgi:hypothetical protein
VELGIALKGDFVVGDRRSDIEAGGVPIAPPLGRALTKE